MNKVLAIYESQGLRHQLTGTASEVYTQLDILCDILHDFHFVSVTPIKE